MKSSKTSAVVATLLAAALFGTSATSRSLSEVNASSTSIASARLFVGALGLLLLVTFLGRFKDLVVLWKMPLIWLMALGVAGYQWFFFIGTGLTGVAVGTLASLALAPLFAGLLSKRFLQTSLSAIWWQSTVLAVLGVALLSGDALVGDSKLNFAGILAAVAAGFSYAIYTVLGSKLSVTNFNSTDVLAAAFALGAIFLLPGLRDFNSELVSPAGIGLILWLGLVATTFAYFLFGLGLRKLSAGTVATLNLAEPLVATALGIWLLSEEISQVATFGALLIATALSLLAYSTLKDSKG